LFPCAKGEKSTPPFSKKAPEDAVAVFSGFALSIKKGYYWQSSGRSAAW
jgi:hypothetical protein